MPIEKMAAIRCAKLRYKGKCCNQLLHCLYMLYKNNVRVMFMMPDTSLV